MSLCSRGEGSLRKRSLLTQPAGPVVGGKAACGGLACVLHKGVWPRGRGGPEIQPVLCPLSCVPGHGTVCWETGAPFSDVAKAQCGPSVPQAGPASPDFWTGLALPQDAESPLSLIICCGPQGVGIFLLRATLLIPCSRWDNA